MKKLIALLFCITFVLSSCSEVTEEIWINADGSGRTEITQDLSQLLPFMQMGIDGAKKKLAEGGAEKEDAKVKKGDMQKLLSFFEKGYVDTTFQLGSMLEELSSKSEGKKKFSRESFMNEMMGEMNADERTKNLTEGEKETMKGFFDRVLDMVVKLDFDKNSNKLNLGMQQDFGSIDDTFFAGLDELFEIFAKIDTEGGKMPSAEKLAQAKKSLDSMPTYSLEKGVMTIKRSAMQMEDPDDPEMAQAMAMASGMMGNMDYITVVHVPGKVKKVNQPNATFKGSTVTWTMPYKDMYDSSKDLNLVINFKPKKKIKYSFKEKL